MPPRKVIRVVHVHGGAFGGGQHAWGVRVAQELSTIVTADGYQVEAVAVAFRKSSVTEKWDDIVEALNGHGLSGSPLVLSGSSSGGWDALELPKHRRADLLYPLAAVVALCPVADPDRRRQYLEHCVEQITPLPDYLAPPAGAPARDARAAKTILELQAKCDGLYDLPKLPPPPGLPVLIIAGGRDKNVPLTHLADAMSTATQSVVFGGKGHELQSSLDGPTRAAIAQFLERHA